jgi:hypothetical protein
MKTAVRLSAIAIAAALAFAPGAGAAHKSGHSQGQKAQHKVEPTHRPKVLHNAAGPKPCPPGLEKKDNGCLPPGQAKKLHGSTSAAPFAKPHYRIGDRFDESIPYYVLRRNEYERYNVPYYEDQYYVRTEDRLLRLDRNTDAVTDIITGLDTLLNN